jgi:hypothetical protein
MRERSSKALILLKSGQTFRIVRIRDIYLGLLNLAVVLFIVGYYTIYVFYFEQKYYVTEQSIGSVGVKVKGSAFSISTNKTVLPWSSEDLVQPAIGKSLSCFVFCCVTRADHRQNPMRFSSQPVFLSLPTRNEACAKHHG